MEVMKQRIDKLSMNNPDTRTKEILKDLDKTFISGKAKEQMEGTIGSLYQYLGFFLDEDIKKVFCSSEPNISVEEVDYGTIIATSIPQRFKKERAYIHTMLKSLLYTHASL